MDGKAIVAQVSKLQSQRYTVDQQYDLIKRLVVPYRGNFFRENPTEHSIEWRENREIYDSTAVMANITLSASLHASLTSSAFQWFSFGFRNDELNENQEAKAWLQECAKRCYNALQDSNFNLEASETYLDLTSYGTSIIFGEVQEEDGDFNEFVFQSIPVEQCYYEQDHRGRLVRFFRKLRWTAEMIRQKFPDTPLPSYVQAKYDRKDPEADIEVIFAVYKENANKDADTSKPLAPANRPYQYKYILAKDATELGSGGYYEMPAFVPRWRKTADSKFGNSPAMAAMPDILTVNRLVELVLVSLEKVVDPAIITTERGLLTQLDLGPSGVNIVKKMGEMDIFESKARFDVAELNREKLQLSINKAFYVDQLELKDSPAMTAMEVRVRYELMQRLLGPTLGRLETDFLNPLVSMTFNSLFRYGKLPDPPQAVIESDAQMDINYIGPLNRAQKSDKVASIQNFVANIVPMAEVKPEVLDIPDFDAIVKEMADADDIPAKLLRTEAQIRKDRADRAEAAKTAQRAELMRMTGEGVQALNGAQQQSVQ